MHATIHVQNKPLFAEHISPLIYGEFVEYIYGMIPGMWGELLRDRSFEGELQPVMYFRKETDFHAPAWRTFSCGDKLRRYYFPVDALFDLDTKNPLCGTQSARVRIGGRSTFLAGICQDDVSVKAGEQLQVQLFLRSDKADTTVQVFIGREYGMYLDRYASCSFTGISREWSRNEATLTIPATDSAASFFIAMVSPGTIWIDKVSLMPVNDCSGWRPDIVETVKAGKPGIIRFGGSSLISYDWQTGIGPREKRVPFPNRYWGTMEELDAGLDEFIRFCELVEAEPLICVNSNTSSPQDIALQVEYVNGPADSAYGRKRAENGHPEPYGVKYWQIGNEQGGPAYEKVLPEYISAMQAVDPSIILLAASGSERLVNGFGGELEYVCPHFYSPDIADAVRETQQLRECISANPAAANMKLGITEWNHTAADWGEPRACLQTLANGLFCARMFNHFQRNGDLIRIANRSNLVNSCFSGSIQTAGRDLYCTPAYYVQKLYATMSGSIALAADTENECLDVSATVDRDGLRCMIWIVNPAEHVCECSLDLHGFTAAGAARMLTLTGPDPDAVNSCARKKHVAPREVSLPGGNNLQVVLQPWSLSGIEIAINGRETNPA